MHSGIHPLVDSVFGHCDDCPEFSDVRYCGPCPSGEHSASSWKIRGQLERTLKIASDVYHQDGRQRHIQDSLARNRGKAVPNRRVTSVMDGVSYLQEIHISNAKFKLQNRVEGAK